MKAPDQVKDVFLQPGAFYFGEGATRIRTLLGSCVAITLWHPALRIGGMCHYLLPRRGSARTGELDGRYGDEAVELFLRELKARGTRPVDYEVKLFGGGNMFLGTAGGLSRGGVAAINVQAGRELLARSGFSILAEHVGGEGHRQVVFELWNGYVWVRQHSPRPSLIGPRGVD